MSEKLNKEKILGVGITTTKRDDILQYILKGLEKKGDKLFIVTPNPEILVMASRYPWYKDLLNQAQISLADGVGVLWASRILGKGVKMRLTGVDFMEFVCSQLSKRPMTVGFLGGREKVAEKTADCLKKKYPGLQVAFVGEEWSQKKVKTNRIDFLFVAFGSPKQEKWIWEHLDTLPVGAVMGVGGAFDFISGKVTRAPKIIRTLGFEWLYRLIRQPWRWRRQLALIEFMILVLKQRMGIKEGIYPAGTSK